MILLNGIKYLAAAFVLFQNFVVKVGALSNFVNNAPTRSASLTYVKMTIDEKMHEKTDVNKIQEAKKLQLRGLQAINFQHPFDQDATRFLKRWPGLETSVRSFLPLIEAGIYLDNIANSVLVGPNQLPSLHYLLIEASKILDIEPPELYVRQNPSPNAYTLAVRGKKPFIVLHTSLVDLLTPEEVQAVIAHELGHLKCEHGVWITAANILTIGISQSGLGRIAANFFGIERLLQRWRMTAELSCDRAALLVAQDVNVVASVLLKLVGGGMNYSSELNSAEFLKQAGMYDTASSSQIGRLITRIIYTNLTHPLPVLRARELDVWANGNEYSNLLQNLGR